MSLTNEAGEICVLGLIKYVYYVFVINSKFFTASYETKSYSLFKDNETNTMQFAIKFGLT